MSKVSANWWRARFQNRSARVRHRYQHLVRNDAGDQSRAGYTITQRHSAGKPCGGLELFVVRPASSSSWTAPVDVSLAEMDAHDLAGQQMRAVMAFASRNQAAFAFDAGYDPTRLAEQVAEDEAAVPVRLRRNRCFTPIRLKSSVQRSVTSHGAKFVCNDPVTCPHPTLSTVKTTRVMVMCTFALGATCTQGRRTIRARNPKD